MAASAASREEISITGSESLAWYHSSSAPRRGFCDCCGSNLFWDGEGRATISIMAGSLDLPTGLETVLHFHAADAGDYYRMPDDAPHKEDGS